MILRGSWLDDLRMWTGIILGTIGGVSSESWPIVWIIIELNLISFLSLISNKWTLKRITMVYFVVQRVGSLAILASRIICDLSSMLVRCISFGLILKLGLAPFHFWCGPFVVLLSSTSSIVFLTWQKIAPMALYINTTSQILLCLCLLLNLIVSASCRIGSKHLYLLLFFSGLIHMRWVIAASQSSALLYFSLYCLCTAPLFFNPPGLPLLILNLAGLPPITGFFIKLIVLQSTSLALGSSLLLFSFASLFAYLRLFLFMFSSSPSPTSTTFLLCFVGCCI